MSAHQWLLCKISQKTALQKLAISESPVKASKPGILATQNRGLERWKLFLILVANATWAVFKGFRTCEIVKILPLHLNHFTSACYRVWLYICFSEVLVCGKLMRPDIREGGLSKRFGSFVVFDVLALRYSALVQNYGGLSGRAMTIKW